VTLGTPCVHLLNIIGLQPHLFRDFPANVREQLADIFQMKSGIEREHIAMTLGAKHVAVRGGMPIRVGLPDFVTTRARSPARVTVVNAGARQKQYGPEYNRQHKAKTPIEMLLSPR
jgi:hypothetical protein